MSSVRSCRGRLGPTHDFMFWRSQHPLDGILRHLGQAERKLALGFMPGQVFAPVPEAPDDAAAECAARGNNPDSESPSKSPFARQMFHDPASPKRRFDTRQRSYGSSACSVSSDRSSGQAWIRGSSITRVAQTFFATSPTALTKAQAGSRMPGQKAARRVRHLFFGHSLGRRSQQVVISWRQKRRFFIGNALRTWTCARICSVARQSSASK